jgi:hypothetical protein
MEKVAKRLPGIKETLRKPATLWFHRSLKMAARNKNTYLTSIIFK